MDANKSPRPPGNGQDQQYRQQQPGAQQQLSQQNLLQHQQSPQRPVAPSPPRVAFNHVVDDASETDSGKEDARADPPLHSDSDESGSTCSPPKHTAFASPPPPRRHRSAPAMPRTCTGLGSGRQVRRGFTSQTTHVPKSRTQPRLRRGATAAHHARRRHQTTTFQGLMLLDADTNRRNSSDLVGNWRRSAQTIKGWERSQVSSPSTSSEEVTESGEDLEVADSRVTNSTDEDSSDPLSSSEEGSSSEGSHSSPRQETCPRRERKRRRRKHRLRGVWKACPSLHRWLKLRVGGPGAFCTMLGFLAMEVLRRCLEEWCSDSAQTNSLSISMVTHFVTMTVSIIMCAALGLRGNVFAVFTRPYTWRWLIIAVGLLFSYYLSGWSTFYGLDYYWITMYSYASLPIAILLGMRLFRRTYGRLELIAAAMMTLAIGAFWLLRLRCAEGSCGSMMMARVTGEMRIGMVLVLFGVMIRMMSWTGAELLLKVRTKGFKSLGVRSDEAMWVMLAHLAALQGILNLCVWLYHNLTHTKSPLNMPEERPFWFGVWRAKDVLLVITYTIHMCLSVHIIKNFSVVTWELVKVVGGVVAVCAFDPSMHANNFAARAIPSLLLAPIILLSAIIFQTGRLNLRLTTRRLGIKPDPEEKTVDFWWCLRRKAPERVGSECSENRGSDEQNVSETSTAPVSPSVTRSSSEPTTVGSNLASIRRPGTRRAGTDPLEYSEISFDLPPPKRSSRREFLRDKALRILLLVGTYSSVIVYILSQAFRENFTQKAQSSRVVVPQSLNFITSVIGLTIGVITVLWSYGLPGLKQAFNWRKILKILFASFLFAVSAFLSCMAFALGASAPAKDAAGRIYTPACALLSRYILGKFYIWLEWLSLIILTFACMTFGLLDAGGESSSMAGLLCAVLSGVVSAVNSIAMEALLRGETDPYIIQSARITFGSLIFNGLFVFVMGFIGEAESPQRLDFAYWHYRPSTRECAFAGTCTLDGVFMPSNVDANVDCTCAKGLLVGWTSSWYVYAAIGASVIYNFATGLVVKQFSSVYRSVADGIMLLVLYFILTPVLDDHGHLPFTDMAKNMVVLIVPLSGVSFSYAAAEMQKVFEVATFQRSRTGEEGFPGGSTDSDMTTAEEDEEDESTERRRDEATAAPESGRADLVGV